MGYVLIIGANTDIGKVLAEKYALEGYNLHLADTNMQELENTKQYLTGICEAEIKLIKLKPRVHMLLVV